MQPPAHGPGSGCLLDRWMSVRISRLITQGVVLTLRQSLCPLPRSVEATTQGRVGEAAPEGNNSMLSSPSHSVHVHTRTHIHAHAHIMEEWGTWARTCPCTAFTHICTHTPHTRKDALHSHARKNTNTQVCACLHINALTYTLVYTDLCTDNTHAHACAHTHSIHTYTQKLEKFSQSSLLFQAPPRIRRQLMVPGK